MKYFLTAKLLPGAQLDPPAAVQGPVRRLRQLCGLRPAQELRHVITLPIIFGCESSPISRNVRALVSPLVR